jgi:hypothetical protein
LTAKRKCWDLTACQGSRSCPAGRPLEPRSSTPLTHDGDDLRNLPFLGRKATLARLLCDTEAGILLNEHVAEDGPTVFAHTCQLGAEDVEALEVLPVPRLDRGPQFRQHPLRRGGQRDLESMPEADGDAPIVARLPVGGALRAAHPRKIAA